MLMIGTSLFRGVQCSLGMLLFPLWNTTKAKTGVLSLSIGSVAFCFWVSPPDYREDEFVANAISPFGRVMYWIDNTAHLTRLLVRAKVIDYESVPQFVVMTEGEGFQGESWTVQCEILQGNLLGGMAADDDPEPGPHNLPPGGPFDFFGFGQQGPGTVNPPPHQNGSNPPPHQNGPNPQNVHLAGGQNQPMEAAEAWDAWPEHNPVVQNIALNIDINEAPQMGIDLNEAPDQEEMIVDPLFPPMHEEAPEPVLVQVNEAEEENEMEEEEEVVNNDNQEQMQEVQAQVNMPALMGPVNVFPLEIQKDDLMIDEEIQNQAALNDDDAPNVFVGKIQLLERPAHGLFEQQLFGKPPRFFFDPSGLWGKFFAPSNGKTPACSAPSGWANFFTAILLSPKMFAQAKEMLDSKALIEAIGDEPSVGFVLPRSCPVKNLLVCKLTEALMDTDDMENTVQKEDTVEMEEEIHESVDGTPDSQHSSPSKRKTRNKVAIVVDTQVRRSPRIKGHKKGYKDVQC